MIDPDPSTAFDYAEFQILVEDQGLRSVRKYLDYDKRTKAGGMAELAQWVGKR